MVNFIIDGRLPSEVADDPDTMKRFLIPSSLEFQRLWVVNPPSHKQSL